MIVLRLRKGVHDLLVEVARDSGPKHLSLVSRLGCQVTSEASLPVPAPGEHRDLVQARDHVVAIRGDVGVSLEVLVAALPQQVDRAKSARDVPSTLRGMSQVLSEGSTQELAEEEVIVCRRPVEDGRAVELDDGLQEQRMAGAAVDDALEDVIATVAYRHKHVVARAELGSAPALSARKTGQCPTPRRGRIEAHQTASSAST